MVESSAATSAAALAHGQRPEERDFSPAKLKIAFACLAGMMLGGVGFASGAITIVMAPLSRDFGWGRGPIGLSITLMTWAGAAALPLAGRYVDRVNSRRALIACTVLIGLLTMALALCTRHILQFYGCFVLLGVLGASSVAYTRIVSALFTRHRGKALAIFTVEATVVQAIMPQVMRVLYVRFGWRGLFVSLGLITLVVAVPLLIAFLKDPTTASRGRAAAPALAGMTAGEALRSIPFWLILAANIGGGLTIYGLLPHIVGMMTSRGLSLGQAVGALSLLALFIAVGQFSSGFVVDRIGTARIASAYLVLFLIGIILLSRASAATGPLPLYAGIALMGLGGGSQAPMGTYFFTRYFGLKALAEITGLYRALQAVLTAPAPWIIGLVYDRTGSYDFAFVLFTCGCVSSIILLALLPPYRFAANAAPAADA